MSVLQEERVDDGIVVLRLDRPEVRNALDSTALAEFEAVLAALSADESVRVLIVSTTSERALSAGADVAEAASVEAGVARMEAFARFYAAVERFPVPTIAVCVGNGVVAGTGLAAGCDRISTCHPGCTSRHLSTSSSAYALTRGSTTIGRSPGRPCRRARCGRRSGAP